MSGAVSSRQAAGAGLPSQAGGRRRSARGRWAAAGVAIVVLAGVVAAGVAGAFGSPGSPAAAGNGYHTATAMVTRRSLTSQTQVAATLGDAGSYSVVNQVQPTGTGSGPGGASGSGTITSLPAVGPVVRQGQVLYAVSGSPVVLLYGAIPAYRDLSEGDTGADVTELNADLVRLGYLTAADLGPRSGWDYYSAATAYGVELLQAHLGVIETGSLALGQAVFLPGPIEVTGYGTNVVQGGAATPGQVVLTASSTTPVVTIALDAAQQTEVHVGERVSIMLPDGSSTPGVVSSVSKVATSSSSPSASSNDSGTPGSGSSPTITVLVSLSDPRAAGSLNQAPVDVMITTGSVSSALVVPVTALLAQASGGYAVEVIGAGGRHYLVAVTPGVFDDAAGLVQVTGAGLEAGQRVVVPAA